MYSINNRYFDQGFQKMLEQKKPVFFLTKFMQPSFRSAFLRIKNGQGQKYGMIWLLVQAKKDFKKRRIP
jgi:hypothetical protein